MEIKTIKDKLTEKENLKNLDIKDLDIKDLLPQTFNGTSITIMDGRHTLFVANTMDGAKFKTFKKTIGGIFNQDVLSYSRKKESGKYVLIEGNGARKIVRLIEDEELLLFKTLRLIKGIVKDKPYMLLRSLGPKDRLNGGGKYIEKENSEIEIEPEEMIIAPHPKIEEEDHDSKSSSVSLFDK